MRHYLKSAMLLFGCVAVLIGLLWIGQGTSTVRWPESSFMIDARAWVWYGLALAVVGIGLAIYSQRRA
jgi:hypothetical protein